MSAQNIAEIPALIRRDNDSVLPGDAVISVRGLTKTYRVERRKQGRLAWLRSFLAPTYQDIRAFDGISFSIGQGEIVGLLGPNGAGKSTTVKIISGVLHPTGGDVRILGRDPHRQRIENAQEIGVLFGHRSHLIYELPPIDSFRFLHAVYQIDQQAFERQVTHLTGVLDLERLLRQPVRTLSLGQRMRCEVAATFLHQPKVVYLDEPTIGLDVDAKRSIRAFIRAMVEQFGVTVILTTHDLADIEELCEGVILIDRGRIVYDGRLQRLRAVRALEDRLGRGRGRRARTRQGRHRRRGSEGTYRGGRAAAANQPDRR